MNGPVFKRVNVLLTGFRSLLFLGVAGAWTLAGPKIGLKAWLVLVIVYAAAGIFTVRFPGLYVSRIMKGRLVAD